MSKKCQNKTTNGLQMKKSKGLNVCQSTLGTFKTSKDKMNGL